jgi:Gram-negative bacterial TonB protein C-terminal
MPAMFEALQPGHHPPPNRVAHPFAHSAKGWGIARSAIALAMLIGSASLCAQTASCGLGSISENSQLAYPPIAIAARVQGDVVLMTSFTPSGEVLSLRVLGGPEMLKQVAQDFVTGWHVNRYGGPRECAIVIRFRIGKESDKPKTTVTRIDPQHVLITAESYPTSGPNYGIASK